MFVSRKIIKDTKFCRFSRHYKTMPGMYMPIGKRRKYDKKVRKRADRRYTPRSEPRVPAKPKPTGWPKRPLSAYTLWVADNRAQCVAEHPDNKPTEIIQLLAAKWRDVKADKKVVGKYIKQAAELKETVEVKSEETVDIEQDTPEPQQLHQLIDIRARTAELTDEEWEVHHMAQYRTKLKQHIAKNERSVIDRAMFSLIKKPLTIVKLIEKALYEPRKSSSSSMCISLTLGEEREITFDTAYLFAMRFVNPLSSKCVEDWRVKLAVFVGEAMEQWQQTQVDGAQQRLQNLRLHFVRAAFDYLKVIYK